MKLAIFLSVALFAVFTSAHKTGAPPKACEGLEPKHKDWKAQTTSSPYKIEAKKVGDSIEVTIKITDKTQAEKFKGFILVARDVSNKNVGTWEQVPKAKLLKCDNDNDAVTHETNEEKETIKLKWKIPKGLTGAVCFKGAVVKNGKTWWKGLKSNPVDV